MHLVCRLLLEKNFFNDTATTEIYTLSLHDALPILHACLSRKTSSEPLFFKRTDSTETDPERDRRFITVRQENGEVIYGSHPLYYFGDLETEYEKRNGDYIRTEQKGAYRK